MIANAVAAENLANFPGFAPVRESHVRELLRIDGDDDRASVWQTGNR